MIGFRHVMTGQGQGVEFTQLLSSVRYLATLPIGMIDSVNGNNANYVETPCFRGNNSGYYIINQINTLVGDKIDISVYVITDIVNQFIFCAKSDSLTGYYLINPLNGSVNSLDWRFNNQKCNIIGGSSLLPLLVSAATNNEIFKIRGVYQNGLGTWHFTNYITGDTISESMNISGTESDSYINRIGGRSGDTFNLSDTDNIFNLEVSINDVLIHNYPMPFTIKDPAAHTYFDVVGDNHAVGVNITSANNGTATRPDYGQLGYTVSDGINYYYDQALTQLIPIGVKIPALASDLTKCVAYTTGGVRANLEVKPEGEWFLNTGAKIKNADVTLLKSKDIHNVWYDGLGVPKNVTFSELEAAISAYPDTYGGDVVSGKSIKNISLK